MTKTPEPKFLDFLLEKSNNPDGKITYCSRSSISSFSLREMIDQLKNETATASQLKYYHFLWESYNKEFKQSQPGSGLERTLAQSYDKLADLAEDAFNFMGNALLDIGRKFP